MRLGLIIYVIVFVVLVVMMFSAKIWSIFTINSTSDREMFPQNFDASIVLGEDPNHLMWFIHVSDLHLSIFHDEGRIDDFKRFCNTTIDAIKPAVVLASGDLTDGKAPDNMGSNQYIEEWKYYKEILDVSNVSAKTLWLDIRGNHDNFNVAGVHSERSYYHQYSVQGKQHPRSYMRKVTIGSESYSFIAVDACLEPGPRRPFNFIGSITDDQFEVLREYELLSRRSNATIWFGHYPTSCIISPHRGIRYLMRNGLAYLCGHLHTLGGLVPKMYALQSSGVMELELGDWKDNRVYRVAAFDHGLFTFTDTLHDHWPVILITNPKHALFNFNEKEPGVLMKQSTHIRVLVFSPNLIEKVRVKFDRENEWLDCYRVERGPLYVAQWNPRKYFDGIHFIQVYARDSAGNSHSVTQPFSLDGTKLSFDLLAKVVLMTEAREVFQFAFAILVVISVLPLVTLRVLGFLVRRNILEQPSIPLEWYGGILRQFWLLAAINKFFFPLVIYPIYLVFGPWFVGEIIEGFVGVTFAWGTWVQGKLLPGSFTYCYGAIQLFFFHLPFTFLLTRYVDSKCKNIYSESNSTVRSCSTLGLQISFSVLIAVQALFAYYMCQAYGGVAFIFGPLRTWSVLMNMLLWYFCSHLVLTDFADTQIACRTSNCSSRNGRTLKEL